jgi:inhibitor of cysteine peptidase
VRALAAVIVSALVFACLCGCVHAEKVEAVDIRVGEESNGTELSLKVGQVVRLSLPENRTTGYRWKIERDGSPFCSMTGDTYIPPEDAASHVGAGGTHEWRFRADTAGATSIDMELLRGWESKAAKRFSLRLRVT